MTELIDEKEGLSEQRRLVPVMEARQVELRMAAVGVVKADEARLDTGIAGVVIATKQASLERAGARTIVAGGPTEIRQGGAAMILSAGETSVTQGGAGTIASLGNVRVEQGGSMMLLAKDATVGREGFVAFALTPHLEVHDGGRVLIGGREAAGVLGAIASVGVLIVALAVRRRGASTATA